MELFKNLFIWILLNSIVLHLSSAQFSLTDLLVNTIDTVGDFAKDILVIPPISEAIQVYCANPTEGKFVEILINDTSTYQILDFEKEIGFLTHGWHDSVNSKWMQNVTEDWIKYRDMNVCRVNWKNMSDVAYVVAATQSTRVIGKYLSRLIESLILKGADLNRITLVGHSLGAHVMGLVGSYFLGQISRIIGLDAAGPLFTIPIPTAIEYRLDRTDARQVIFIHSGDGWTGIGAAYGHQDFYANGGTAPQIGCQDPILYPTYVNDTLHCTHTRAIDFFQSSLDPNHSCVAIKCNNNLLYAIRWCQSITNKVGLDANRNFEGQFYFATGGRPTCTGHFWN